MTHGPWARFDDLRAGTAIAFPAVRRTLVARRADDVVAVLQEVERATLAGSWAFGYVAYEAASGLDPRLSVHPTPAAAVPLVWFGLTEEPVPVAPLDAPGALRPPGASRRPRATSGSSDREVTTGYEVQWSPSWTSDDHHRGVARIRERIERGETYQCNFTVRMDGRFAGDPLQLYRDLALGQRGAHNAYLDLGRLAIASASPELFFQRVGDDLRMRPMKGTAPRGRNLSEDRRRARVLHSSPKERAENVMIVDLIRNDASRVSEVGSVSVPALCRVERYETVLQLTSDVLSRVRSGVGLTELFQALFPSGSVTGAPKVSTMALIRELEPVPRGVYCGAIGFVGPPGADVQARFSVAIRTAVIDRVSGSARYGVGGGITWDSEAAAEHAEVIAKTAVLRQRPQEFELFETMRYDPEHGLRNRNRHLRRLADSAEHLGFRFDLAIAVDTLRARLSGLGPSRVRLRLSRSGAVAVDLSLLPANAGTVTLAIDEEAIDSTDSRLFHKSTFREPYERRQRRHSDADDVVMLNERGELTEVTRANLALRLDGRWWTPTLWSGCLPGVERGRLIDRKKLSERVLHLADLRRAEKIAVVSSLRGWRPAVLAADASSERRRTRFIGSLSPR